MPPNGRKGAKRVHGNASPSTVYRAHVRAMYRHDAKGPILFGIELSCTNFESTDVASTVRAPTLRQTFSSFSGLPDPSFTFTQACCEKAAGEGGEEKGKDLQDDLTSAIFSQGHIQKLHQLFSPWKLGNFFWWLHGSSLKKWSESRVSLNPVLNHHRPFQNRHIPHSSPNPKISVLILYIIYIHIQWISHWYAISPSNPWWNLLGASHLVNDLWDYMAYILYIYVYSYIYIYWIIYASSPSPSAEYRPLGLPQHRMRLATAQPRSRASGRKAQAARAAPKRRICRGLNTKKLKDISINGLV